MSAGAQGVRRSVVMSEEAADDDSLIAAVAANDNAAWREVVDRHLAGIMACAWHMLHDRTEAEDVAQEVFLRLRDKAATWKPGPVALGAWLNRVAVNLCIDRLRRLKLMRMLGAANIDPDAEAGPGLERDIAITREVMRALARLPARQRAAITLIHYQGFSGREAAGMLGISEDAVESLLSRARRSLRRDLEPAAGDLLGET
jgi:RNA polymerase sigma-70 factor (ECF subfamily)